MRSARPLRCSFPVMGTVASLTIAAHRPGPGGRGALHRAAGEVRRCLVEDDERFSRYRPTSELERYRGGRIARQRLSAHMLEVMRDCESLERLTDGAFRPRDAAGMFDPTGYVKGWAMERAVQAAIAAGARDVCLNVGGDVRTAGAAAADRPWRVGVRSPSNGSRIIAVVAAPHRGAPIAVATSGRYERGNHLWSALGHLAEAPADIAVTVVGGDAGIVDAGATAVWVRAATSGTAAGLAMLDRWDGCEGMLALGGELLASAGMTPFLVGHGAQAA